MLGGEGVLDVDGDGACWGAEGPGLRVRECSLDRGMVVLNLRTIYMLQLLQAVLALRACIA